MKKLTAVCKKITTQRENIRQLESSREAECDAVDRVKTHTGIVENLKANIRSVKAEALVVGKQADTTGLDQQLVNAEDQRVNAVAAAQTSIEATAVIDAGIELARAALTDLEEEAKQLVADAIMETHDDAQRRYLEIIDQMAECVQTMAGAHQAWILMLGNDPKWPFPGRGAQVREDVLTHGLRVPVEYSRLNDPTVAEEYTADYRDLWYPPAWADKPARSLGEATAEELVSAVRGAGFECVEFKLEPAPVPEKQVAVRVLRGTIPVTKHLKHPATGEIVSSTSKSYGPGSEIEIAESSARHLRSTGFVSIVGEDDEPGPSDSDPKQSDSARIPHLPEQFDLVQSRHDSYSGAFHALDTRAYE
ncbi:hypothetical protein PI86_10995 [Burkholderia sp. A9]|uniref:hypothetical protein n=1 Tax=Burkholderia sp. A9 TaxID=1365108 RepID=UPI0005747B8F|nr:hypothetical protein [Burkholderia sp. A9]KHK58132.1 hypothetical protein PI86_10995 [Burkholderia sp. A9]